MDGKTIFVDQLGLSVRASNVLRGEGIRTLDELMQLSEEQLRGFRNCGEKTVVELLRTIEAYRRRTDSAEADDGETSGAKPAAPDPPLSEQIMLPELRESVLRFAENHDWTLDEMGLGNRAKNRLQDKGYASLSDILFLSVSELYDIPAMGALSVQNVLDCREAWINAHESGLRAALAGDESALLPPPLKDAELQDMILRLYKAFPYAGLSLQDFTERLPSRVSPEQTKKCVGSLLAQGKLEYVDFRCYRVYPPFAERLAVCGKLSERDREMIAKRLQGATLEAAGREYGLTRERMRQIMEKSRRAVRSQLAEETGSELFDEDYYQYFYQTYAFDKKDAAQWFGLSAASLRYLELVSEKGGSRPLENAQEDQQLSPGLRQRIRNYLRRNMLYLDGRWIPKKRDVLEQYVVEHYCRENVSFSEFIECYNAFLRERRVPFDEGIYCTEAMINTRRNRLRDAHFLLWKQNELLRAYDVDGRDYGDLISGLGLDELENIELSTQKFVDDDPLLMERYDIRDRYELHNLLRKILPNGSFHNLKIERTPNICFGSFDRDAALLDLMLNNVPISMADLTDLIRKEYGYDPGITASTYLSKLSVYYHQGVYDIEKKPMSPERQAALLAVLEDDFYYYDELKAIYGRLFPDADPDEVNPSNLKQMGFSALRRYAFRGFGSLDACFRNMLTRNDLLDITDLRRRYTYVQAFSSVLTDLKHSLEVVEYEPNKLISSRKLSAAGVARADIADFCDAVYAFVEDGAYFTAKSLRLSGFQSELYELGFSDWFYANLLLSDPRFSYGTAYKSIVLYKGNADVTVRSFVTALIREAGSIDVYDLQREMEETYGCVVPDRLDLVYKTVGGVYHDKHLDRLYESEALYWREVDETEELL